MTAGPRDLRPLAPRLRARREEGQRLGRAEMWVASALWLLAALEVVLLLTGKIEV